MCIMCGGKFKCVRVVKLYGIMCTCGIAYMVKYYFKVETYSNLNSNEVNVTDGSRHCTAHI